MTSPHMQRPRLPDERDDGCVGLDQHVDLRIILALGVRAAGAAEGRDLCLPEFPLGRLGEEVHVLRVGARPAAFNVIDAKGVEALGNTNLVSAGKIDSFALRPVTERRIVDVDFSAHWQGKTLKPTASPVNCALPTGVS